MEFIRSQRAQKNYNSNLRHVFYSPDADVLLLGLSTHEPNFYVLRENTQDVQCYRCNRYGHIAQQCPAKRAFIPKDVDNSNNCTIHVGNIPYTATEKELRDMFGECGVITEVRIALDKNSFKPKGFAFVEFMESAAAKKALKLDNKSFSGRKISVSFAKERMGPKPEAASDDKLVQFQSVTQLPLEDCIQFLTAANWNLERAVTLFLDPTAAPEDTHLQQALLTIAKSDSAPSEHMESSTNTVKRKEVKYVLVQLSILREYLAFNIMPTDTDKTESSESNKTETSESNNEVRWDIERIVDDFIFICTFLGNDFLPSLTCTDIFSNGMEILLSLYRDTLQQLHGEYLTHDSQIHWKSVLLFMKKLCLVEEQVAVEKIKHKKRLDRKNNWKDKIKHKKNKDKNKKNDKNDTTTKNDKNDATTNKHDGKQEEQVIISTPQQQHSEQSEGSTAATVDSTAVSVASESSGSAVSVNDEGKNEEKPKMNWRWQYYSRKFPEFITPQTQDAEAKEAEDKEAEDKEAEDKEAEDKEAEAKESDVHNAFFNDLSASYIKGLQWVRCYYFEGLCSWKWYYKYHYAPLCRELVLFLEQFDGQLDFEKGTPFTPLQQLMAILPPSSAQQCVPKELYELMISATSPLIEYYPEQFRVDARSKHAGQRVVLLNFIDESLFLNTIQPIEQQLSQQWKELNRFDDNMLYVHTQHSIAALWHKESALHQSLEICIAPHSELAATLTAPHPSLRRLTQSNKDVLCVAFHLPKHSIIFGLLPNASFTRTLTEDELKKSVIRSSKLLQAISCYLCGQIGHNSKECPTPHLAKCFKCKKAGHFAADCKEQEQHVSL